MFSVKDNIFRISKFTAHPLFIDQTFLTINSGRAAKTRNLKTAGGPCPAAVFWIGTGNGPLSDKHSLGPGRRGGKEGGTALLTS